MSKVFFKTFGCRTNFFDTQVMKENLKDFTITYDESEAQIIVINSCTVTNGADSGVRQYINKIKKQGKKIYFTGCGAKTQGQQIAPMVFGIFQHEQKEQINALLKQETPFFLTSENEKHIDSTLVSEFAGRNRAFIKIQEGCDFACSYCIIPHTRGRARSLPQDSILQQVKLLADSGIQEIVLTGTNMGSYGKDTQSSVAQLIKAIAKTPNIRRIRIGSLEPSQIDEEFLEILGESFLERHLHIALQHSHNKMLEIMNRINRFEEDYKLLETIANKGFAIGTDYIVGHPGESEKIWQEAYQNLKTLPLTHLHPFIYSPRNGTPSAQLQERINGTLAKSRLHQIKTLIEDKNRQFRIQHSQDPLSVLIEQSQDGAYIGLDQFFNRTKIIADTPIEGFVTITDYHIAQDCNIGRLP
ncbi:tRNA (N(6)-L-threonylcarbamoyladenosine(37)-C(2))-methylthiotransferase MtaB [Helicobacter enhydrae]|uniref:tRNA (N(6)-L-threonylcarbamoyladenosine(37)-C(2))-methylthiotransferase MtaB n=1 Tax=Helicobacter enhydrae TaxID=222136 RepID=A0A1B1U3S9_9HELI|nr:tRNA (N(6)-L-threonylcarbamoyladenosine(37)-C(2))-methylthiotransferase MtaB [Helicobacter enhydrae]ANV97401.1 tRNA (N(6)-L-threonylcarbamoyladenosine(37)-C(2))-methylthiotransferase MtaB [Helicobacter enhydrae]